EVVIKSQTGSTGRGVFPLRRSPDGWTIVTKTDAIEPQNIAKRLRTLQDDGLVSGPYFAEELLGRGDGNALPVDVKILAFYGEIGLVLLRSAAEHADTRANTFRSVLEDGTEVGPIHWKYNPEIPIPGNLDKLVDVARRLSLSISRAFVRIDMYEIGGRIVFGELTPRPGGGQDFGPEHDERLGHLWERAHARVLNDVTDGSDYILKFGPEPRELRIGKDVFLPA
ncbi:MAG: ATP-grasp fold amidoligase family protein, partial [Aeromicrobium sp.]